MNKYLIIALSFVAASALSASAADAKELYAKNCAKCHGTDGKGETKMGKKVGVKDLTDPKIQGELTDQAIFKSIKEGVKKDDKTVMKAVEGLSDDEIKSLVAEVRTFKK